MRMCDSSMLAPVLSVLSGVFFHCSIWIRGEWDPYSGQILLCAFLTHHALSMIIMHIGGVSFLTSQTTVFSYELYHVIGLLASIVLYRLYFHPLRRYPGPLGAKIWIWDIFARTWLSGDRHSIVIADMHARYGPIVRYAPDRISINLAAAVPLIHGTGSTSKCTKSVVYLNPVNGGSINADRDVNSHHARRKIWERALASRVLPTYILPLSQLTDALVSKIRSTDAQAISVNDHVQLFTFDAMGLIGFGRKGGFDGLRTGVFNPAIAELIGMMRIGVYMMLVPWLHVLLDYVPTMGIIHKPDEVFREFAKETLGQYCGVEDQKKVVDEEAKPTPLDDNISPSTGHEHDFKDILNRIHPNPSLDDRRTLSDCVLLSIAGADTTTSSIVHTIYRLARHRDLQAKIYNEILAAQPLARHTSSTQGSELATWIESAKLPYLEAFLREVLRLHPPAPTGLPRLTPAEGLRIAQPDGDILLIPGNTNVSAPVYTLLRDPQNFAQPLDFLPERFLPQSHSDARPELVHDMRAYIPFLQGPYGCAGKQLAYLEMKIVIAGLVNVFEIMLSDGETAEDVNRNVEMKWADYSTVKAARFEARFIPRHQDVTVCPLSDAHGM